MKRSVLLSSFLVAALLSPVVLYGNTCLPVGDAKLAVLQLRVDSFLGENTIEGFDPDVLSYDALFPESATVGALWVKAQDLRATIEVEYDGELVPLVWHSVARLDVPLGSSELAIHVSANPSGSAPTSQTYVVRIRRGESCEQVGCDDENECTEDLCNPSNGLCDNAAVQDGTPCAADRGGCYGGSCNFVPVSVTLGAKEVVFDWTTDRCEDLDVPDGPADLVRAEDGELVLFANNAPRYRVSRGADFDTLEQVCDPPALVSADLRTPESYENWEWPWSFYREGATWHTLIHNEFHDAVAPTCKPGDPSPSNLCWYNSITYAVSTDGARSFAKPSPPAHVVAPAPRPWEPPPTPPQFYTWQGYAFPSNIVRAQDQYYYALIAFNPDQSPGACLIRTHTLGDPTSWRAWDGSGFNLSLESPYEAGGEVPACEFIATPETEARAFSNFSLTYNTYLDRYMLVSLFGETNAQGDLVCGIYFALSTELLHWSEGQIITPARITCPTDDTTPGQLEPVRVLYPSIIDHQDSTVNFDRPGQSPYLYYTRLNDDTLNSLDRDLVRVPLTFTLDQCDGVDCDDQNACTADVCNPVDGSCTNPPSEDGTLCADGLCVAGECGPIGSVLPCTEQGIRAAITTGGGPYTFDCATPTTIVTAAEIVIDNNVILDGQGKLTVDANAGHRVLSVAAGATAELIGFTVTGGSTVESGGGILNAGTLALTNSTISGNSAQSSGGVRNLETGTLTIANSVISQNTAAQFGGGMHNFGQAEIVDTTISNNTAESGSGGVSNRSGATLTLTSSLVQGNTSALGAGGISNAGTMTLTTTTILGNEAGTRGGGVSNNDGVLTLANATVSGNASGTDGGGVWNDDASVVTLTNSTISENTAINQGGGIFSGGTLTLSNSTVFGNSAVYGAGIYNDYTAVSLTLTNTTVSLNSATNAGGGGIANLSVMTLVSTTLSDNLATEIGSAISNVGAALVRNTIIDGDCWFATPLDSLGGNIESEGNTCGFGHPTDKTVPAPLLLLGPLQDNGGPTMTHALLPGSEAIDWIPEAMCIGADGQPLTTDQRGQPRPAGPGCDVGSFEVQP